MKLIEVLVTLYGEWRDRQALKAMKAWSKDQGGRAVKDRKR